MKMFLDSIVKVLNIIRESNVTLNWLKLHETNFCPLVGVNSDQKPF